MAKDPALLWYWGDWHSGTSLMSRFIKGCYIDVLHAQFNNGHLSLEEIKTCLGSDFGQAWPTLQKKFKKDENGLFFNERLEREKNKRIAYSESRSKNRKNNTKGTYDTTYDSHMVHHMENENENENRIKKKGGMGERKKEFKPPDLLEFQDYWRESGYSPDVAKRAWEGYSENDWHDSKGNQVRNWKQKSQHVWFKDENKIHQNGTYRQNTSVGRVTPTDAL